MALDKTYDPALTERRWYPLWMARGYFRPEYNPTGPLFSIVIPPPNITGSLHMGHALNNTLQDLLCRYKRMDGYRVLWVPGTDHAGIATQNVIERQLQEQGTDRWQLGREKFIERVWTWRDESGRTIMNQLKALGVSCDWSRERFTMDAGLSRAVREVFVRLYEEGLIYRGRYLINWCPRCQTALSDLEVEQRDNDGQLYHLTYPRSDGKGTVAIATTRPETMLGDTAVAVHPDDERYRDLVGQNLTLPVLGRQIPVIADTRVDREFGTGALKVTPAHDFIDFEIGREHNLSMISVLDEQARMTQEAGPYQGMDRFECRSRLVEDLKQSGALIRVEPYKIMLGHCYRCQTVVEPFLSTQWFVRIKLLAEGALAAVKEGKTQFFPTHWEKTYFAWMENIRDWCISRQLWWGHRIPAWYCDECGAMLVSREDLTVCTQCGGGKMTQETDVLDTWFSSGLWPFSTMGWPDQTEDLKTFYPTSVLVTGFDIIFFWVARMMMWGLKFMDDVPFRHVYIHALVRDERGQKMSKSKGNVIDPLEIMGAYGTDALRFTLTALSAMGRDIRLSTERITGYRNFANKMWNAARFVLLNEVSSFKFQVSEEHQNLGLAERWILSRLNRTIKEVRQALDEYRFNEVAGLLYQFMWHEFCDWYLELSKIALESGDAAKQEQTRAVLTSVLDSALRLLHPVMPFITEEIWHAVHPDRAEDSIMVQSYPMCDPTLIDDEVEQRMGLLMDVIRSVRNIRSEMNLPPGRELTAVVIPKAETTETQLRYHEHYVRRLARLGALRYQVDDDERPRGTALAVVEGAEIHIPLAGVVNLQEETKRLEREMSKVCSDLASVQRKLGDAKFLERAPEEVVEKERERGTQLEEKRVSLEKSLERLRQIEA